MLFAIALSGGADSLALTLLAAQWAETEGCRLVALTVDHRLRADSTAEAHRTSAFMQAQGIEHRILTPPHHFVSNNLQEAARDWRYRVLSDYCRDQGILHCLLGHQAGDNRETVQHNRQRGKSAEGLSGMRRLRNFRRIRFLRPLLSIERTELEAYLRHRNVAWIEDPSNQNLLFARVRNRALLQHHSSLCVELDAAIEQHSANRTLRDERFAQAAMRAVRLTPHGTATLDYEQWHRLEPSLASRLLADTLTTIGGKVNRPRAADTARLAAALQQAEVRRHTLHHCEITRRGTHLHIAREPSRTQTRVILSGAGELEWDGRFQVRYGLPEGAVCELGALGPAGKKHLRARGHDLPISTPVLRHLDEIIFVPHIGMPQPAGMRVGIGFAPPKPLAAAPFW